MASRLFFLILILSIIKLGFLLILFDDIAGIEDAFAFIFWLVSHKGGWLFRRFFEDETSKTVLFFREYCFLSETCFEVLILIVV